LNGAGRNDIDVGLEYKRGAESDSQWEAERGGLAAIKKREKMAN